METSSARPTPRRVVIDLLLALAIGWLMIAAFIMVTKADLSHGPFRDRGMRHQVEIVGLGWVQGWVAVTVVGLAARRWKPRAALTVGLLGVGGYLAVGGAAPAAVLVGVVLGLALVARFNVKEAAPWLALLVPAYAAAAPLDAWHWVTVVSMLFWTLAPLAFVVIMRQRRAEQRRTRAAELAKRAHAERLEFAREIHDVVGHSLSLISLQSGVALKVFDNDPVQARASLEAIRSTSRAALDDVRRTLGVFREGDAPLAPTPDLGAIAAVVGQVRASGVDVELAPLPDAESVPMPVQTVAHRIVQESLTNALRHAPGARISVVVSRTTSDLRVVVTDTGTPPATIVEGGGLTGMRERVASVGGRLDVIPSPRGFVVDASLPLEGVMT